jgi:hypothetical protein
VNIGPGTRAVFLTQDDELYAEAGQICRLATYDILQQPPCDIARLALNIANSILNYINCNIVADLALEEAAAVLDKYSRGEDHPESLDWAKATSVDVASDQSLEHSTDAHQNNSSTGAQDRSDAQRYFFLETGEQETSNAYGRVASFSEAMKEGQARPSFLQDLVEELLLEARQATTDANSSDTATEQASPIGKPPLQDVLQTENSPQAQGHPLPDAAPQGKVAQSAMELSDESLLYALSPILREQGPLGAHQDQTVEQPCEQGTATDDQAVLQDSLTDSICGACAAETLPPHDGSQSTLLLGPVPTLLEKLISELRPSSSNAECVDGSPPALPLHVAEDRTTHLAEQQAEVQHFVVPRLCPPLPVLPQAHDHLQSHSLAPSALPQLPGGVLGPGHSRATALLDCFHEPFRSTTECGIGWDLIGPSCLGQVRMWMLVQRTLSLWHKRRMALWPALRIVTMRRQSALRRSTMPTPTSTGSPGVTLK